MKLKRTFEKATRSYDAEGVMTEKVEHAVYAVVTDADEVIGTINCWGERADLGIAITTGTIDEGVERIAALLNAEVEKGGEA